MAGSLIVVHSCFIICIELQFLEQVGLVGSIFGGLLNRLGSRPTEGLFLKGIFGFFYFYLLEPQYLVVHLGSADELDLAVVG